MRTKHYLATGYMAVALVILSLLSPLSLAVSTSSASSDLWNVNFRSESVFTSSEIADMLNDAYSWILSKGLDLAQPCNGGSYNVTIAPYVGFGSGLTYSNIRYDPSTRKAEFCIDYILLDFTWYDYLALYSREYIYTVAIHTVIHELFHAVQNRYLSYYDPDVYSGNIWIIEGSAVAATYLYSRERGYNIELFIADKLEYLVSKDIDVYFASRLYSVDPVEISLKYGYNRLYVYYYSPFFIWFFERYGFDLFKEILSTYNPSESRDLTGLLTQYYIDIALYGFTYYSENRTVTTYPTPKIIDGDSTSVILEPRSSEYLVFDTGGGRYRVKLYGDAEVFIVDIFRNRVLPADNAVYRGDGTQIIVVVSEDKPASVSISLERIYIFEPEKLSLELADLYDVEPRKKLVALEIYNPNDDDVSGYLILQIKSSGGDPIYSAVVNVKVNAGDTYTVVFVIDLDRGPYSAKAFLIRDLQDQRTLSNSLSFRIRT